MNRRKKSRSKSWLNFNDHRPLDTRQASGFLSVKKISNRIKELENLLHFNEIPLEVEFFQTKEELTIHQAVKKKKCYKKIKPGFLWGNFETYGWFRINFKTPSSFLGRSLFLIFKADGEGQVYYNNRPIFSLYLGFFWYPERKLFKIEKKVKVLKSYEFFIEVVPLKAYNKDIRDFPVLSPMHPHYIKRKDVPEFSMFRQASLVNCPEPVMKYYYDLSLLYEIAVNLDKNSPRRREIEKAAEESVNQFNFKEKDEDKVIKNAKRCNELLLPLLEKKNKKSKEKFYVCGNSHLDVAWMWPLRETVRKIARTVSITLRFMDEYKNFKFYQSTALYYEMLDQFYPELYRKVRSRIRQNRWEAGCVSYVEPDCILPDGESLIRQFLFGIRYSKQNFNRITNVVWFPDTFGFSPALPQIIKKSGLEYFMTMKLNWNDTNIFPYSIFSWKGIDGTEILSYIPSYQYITNIRIRDMKDVWDGFKNKDSYQELLYPYGIGDGGGGVYSQMLEYLSRMKDLDGAPKCEHSFMEDYFHLIEKKKKKLPVWEGELYLELHRGTYTTHGLNKKYNRVSEILLRKIEFFSVAGMLNKGQYQYPQKKINQLWKTVLKNQFHDILPGTSITRVHKESHAEYRDILKTGNRLLSFEMDFLIKRINTKGNGIPVVIFNSYSKIRSGQVEIEDQNADVNSAIDSAGSIMVLQRSGRRIFFRAKNIPPFGWKVVWLRSIEKKVKSRIKVTKELMENDLIRLKFNNKGELVSIYDKKNKREILKKGTRGNEMKLYIDKPPRWDAWDISKDLENSPLDQLKVSRIKVLKKGPVKGELEIQGTIGRSSIKQYISICSNSSRIDFKTNILWKEDHRMLKVNFPINIRSSVAIYDIQFGNIRRSTNRKSSMERARFEVYAHKWADISDGNYGAALLNDCKYGYSIKQGNICLSLLRSPTFPDPRADRGEHEFTYSLLPHKGNFSEGRVIDQAYDLNMPLQAVKSSSCTGKLDNTCSFFSVDRENVIIETIKKAEDDNSVILRLYEAYNRTKKVKLKCFLKIRKAFECNLIEEDDIKLKHSDHEIGFQIKPYEIKTFKIYFAG